MNAQAAWAEQPVLSWPRRQGLLVSSARHAEAPAEEDTVSMAQGGLFLWVT